MSVFLDGQGVTALSLTLPRSGPWHADVTLVPSARLPEGKVTLTVFGVEYHGTVLRAGLNKAMPFARMIGGAGGFGTVLAAKAYRGTDVRLPLLEVLAGAGESLASSSDDAALRKRLAYWIRMEGNAGEVLAALVLAAGIPAWRVLADGMVWVGTEAWPATQLVNERVLAQDPHLGRHDLYADVPSIFPGETWNGQRVSVVEHRFTASRLVTSVWVEDSGGGSEAGVKGALDAYVKRLIAPMRYHIRYQCRVVVQQADGTLDVIADDPAVGAPCGVPIYCGIPGVKVKVSGGARCLLEFAGGDRAKPIVTGWEPGDAVEIAFNSGTAKVARVGDAVAADSLMSSWITAVNGALTGSGPAARVPGLTTPLDFGKCDDGAAGVKA